MTLFTQTKFSTETALSKQISDRNNAFHASDVFGQNNAFGAN